MMDYILAWNEINLPKEDKEQNPGGGTRMATQRDFDAF